MNDGLVSGLYLLLEVRLTRCFPGVIEMFLYWTTYFESSHFLPSAETVVSDVM